MPAQVTNYQCPACMGPLHFAGESGKLECEYCGSGFDVAEIEALYAEKEKQAAAAHEAAEPREGGDGWDTSGLSEDWGDEGSAMRELLCEETTAATSCPYCGNPTVVPGQFSGALRPDFILPFKLSKEEAVRALKKHYKGKFFLPKRFTADNHIQEIRGIYVPFWMFDGEAEGDARYEATRTRTYESGGYRITETKYFNVYRSGSVAFEKIPVDASSKLSDDHMDSIEPYDYRELKPFSTAYLPGFLADKYDVSVEQCRERADRRCEGTFASAMRRSVRRYDTCTVKELNVHLRRGKVQYALMPVWMLNTKWKGKDFLFAMNGQTGRLVGDLPVSWGKFWGLFAAIAVPLAALGSALALVL